MSVHHDHTTETTRTQKPRHPMVSLALLIIGFGAAYIITSVLF